MTKTKYKNKLDAEADLRWHLLPIIPDFKFICSSEQSHPSHREIKTNHIYCFIYLTDSVSFIIILFAYKPKKRSCDLHSVFYFACIAIQKHWWGSVKKNQFGRGFHR